MSIFTSQIYIPVLLVVILILSQSIKMVNEYERVVIFRLGRLSGVKGPGIFLIIPIVDRALKIDLRVVAIDVPKQAVITRDNVTVEVDAVVYYKVIEPGAAITQVENYMFATSTLSQTTLRDVMGQMELDELLSERENINKQIQELLDKYTDPWGIKVTGVTIRDVSLPAERLERLLSSVLNIRLKTEALTRLQYKNLFLLFLLPLHPRYLLFLSFLRTFRLFLLLVLSVLCLRPIHFRYLDIFHRGM